MDGRRVTSWVLILLFLSISSVLGSISLGSCSPIFPTGVDEDYDILSPGQEDPHWMFQATGQAAFSVSKQGSWATTNASWWISGASPNPNYGAGSENNFTTTFTLPPQMDLSNFTFKFSAYMDDYLTLVVLNGNPISTGSLTGHPTINGTTGLKGGVNNLIIQITNVGEVIGLNVQPIYFGNGICQCQNQSLICPDCPPLYVFDSYFRCNLSQLCVQACPSVQSCLPSQPDFGTGAIAACIGQNNSLVLYGNITISNNVSVHTNIVIQNGTMTIGQNGVLLFDIPPENGTVPIILLDNGCPQFNNGTVEVSTGSVTKNFTQTIIQWQPNCNISSFPEVVLSKSSDSSGECVEGRSDFGSYSLTVLFTVGDCERGDGTAVASNDGGGGPNLGLAIGLTLGLVACLVFIVIAILIAVFIFKRKRTAAF